MKQLLLALLGANYIHCFYGTGITNSVLVIALRITLLQYWILREPLWSNSPGALSDDESSKKIGFSPSFYATLECESRIQFEKCSKITNNNLYISGQDQSDRAWTALEMSRLTSLHVPSRYSGSSSSVLACTQKQKMFVLLTMDPGHVFVSRQLESIYFAIVP
jgi:hypothetical protein